MKNISLAVIATFLWSTTSAQSEKIDSFLMPAGTVIHVSRDSGFRYLSNLSRQKEKELAMVYLPAQKVWVTISEKRRALKVTSDSKILNLILELAPKIELWHTHPSTKKKDSMVTIERLMPSGTDLVTQFSNYLYKKDAVKITGVVVTEYGATYFWWNTTAMEKAMRMVSIIHRYDIVTDRIYIESERLRAIVGGKSLTELSDVLGNLNGIFRYSFEPLPQ